MSQMNSIINYELHLRALPYNYYDVLKSSDLNLMVVVNSNVALHQMINLRTEE